METIGVLLCALITILVAIWTMICLALGLAIEAGLFDRKDK